jgi:hypothetical protein
MPLMNLSVAHGTPFPTSSSHKSPFYGTLFKACSAKPFSIPDQIAVTTQQKTINTKASFITIYPS